LLAQTGRTVTPQVMFKEVMGVERNGVRDQGEIELVRVTNQTICEANNNNRTITCGDLENLAGNSLAITEYVITHEFGHVFDNQAARGNGRALREYIADTGLNAEPTQIGTHTNGPIWDAQQPTAAVVMGNVEICDSNWLRGERGWGSGPGSSYNPLSDFCTPRNQVFTDYQQNPAPYDTGEQANEETAADMFLNWVYRKLALGGYLNRDWRPHVTDPISGSSCSQIPQGCDATLSAPGDARFNWIQTVMNEIFVARGWN